VRIVVWNMSHWQKSEAERVAGWQWLREVGADVALVQEAVPPSEGCSAVYRPISSARPWGSAVVGFTTEVIPVTEASGRYSSKPAKLLVTHPGAVAVGTVRVGERPLTLVSVYGLIDDGYADTTVNRVLSDLVPLLDDPTLGTHLVFGGDLNITTQWVARQARYRAWQQATLARIAAFGLHDCVDLFRASGPLDGCNCLDGDACRHVRTQYHPRSARPWQNDYVYASDALVADGQVASCRVVDEPDLRPLSDHLPVVLELE
jgi:hypothetical protein